MNKKVFLLMLLLVTALIPLHAQEQPLATIVANQLKIEFVLQKLSEQTGVSVIARGKTVGQRVSLVAKEEPLETVLDKIVSNKPDWLWHKIDDTHYEIIDQATYKAYVLPEQVIKKTFQFKYVQASDVQKAIQGMLTKGIGSAAADERTNKLFVTDLPQVIEQIERLIEEIDIQLLTRIFYIRYADAADVANKINVYKSPPGIIEVDTKTHQIIVTDTLENIRKMEMLIDVLDVGPELRIYDITNIGKKGEEIKELLKVIQEVITKDAFIEVNYKTGKIILEDMPEVHEKVEKILAAFDVPVNQVLIEGEVLATTYRKTLDWSLGYTISENLPAAVWDNVVTLPWTPSMAGDPAYLDDMGFIELYETFPVFTVQKGLSMFHLSKHALVELNTALSDTDTRVLMQPRILVKNHEEAKIDVGKDVPYLTTRVYPDRDRYYSDVVSPEFVREGLQLSLTPSISGKGLIELDVDIENSSTDPVILVYAEQRYSLFSKTLQKTNTTLIIPSGETRVIGGMLDRGSQDTIEGIPILSEIPVIGRFLFGSTSKETARRQILFFITPTIVEESGRRIAIVDGQLMEKPEPEALLLHEAPLPPEFTTPTLMAAPALKELMEGSRELSLIDDEIPPESPARQLSTLPTVEVPPEQPPPEGVKRPSDQDRGQVPRPSLQGERPPRPPRAPLVRRDRETEY